MKRAARISRRTALKGLGVSIALPMLEAIWPAAMAGGGGVPPRLAFLYVPNGVHMPEWTPATTGAGFELSPILEPLSVVKNDLLVLSGLTLNPARSLGDGGGDHARGAAFCAAALSLWAAAAA